MSPIYVWDVFSLNYTLITENNNDIPAEEGYEAIATNHSCKFNEDTGELTASEEQFHTVEISVLYSNNVCYHIYTDLDQQYISCRSSVLIEKKFISTISSNVESDFPEDGKEGKLYYSKKGSDNIDPISIAFTSINNKNETQLNTLLSKEFQQFSIQIQPSQQIHFGGAISYLIEYQQNNEETWTKAYNSMSSLLIPIIVPNNITNIKLRALASDDMGFTSTIYIYTEKVSLNAIKFTNKCSHLKPTFTIKNSLIHVNIFFNI